MPIRPYLDGHQFDEETVRAMGVAFEMTRAALEHADGTASLPAPQMIAAKIVELAKAGEHDPDRLCDRTLKYCHALLRP